MKQVLIDRIEVTLEPWHYLNPGGTHDITLKVRVKTMGQEVCYQDVMRPDDITSRFDMMMERVTSELRRAIKKHADAQEPAVTP